MKKFILITLIFLLQCFSLPVFGSSGTILYCSGEESIGFKSRNSYQPIKFKPPRFKVMVDFKNKTLKSEEISFLDVPGMSWCTSGMLESSSLYCLNKIGDTFSINKNTLKFHFSSVPVGKIKDDIYITHGKCEKF